MSVPKSRNSSKVTFQDENVAPYAAESVRTQTANDATVRCVIFCVNRVRLRHSGSEVVSLQ
jgi:hypothetical protein